MRRTDDEFSTVCIVDHMAKVLERVSYDAYGNPRHHRRSDLNGEGSTNIDDQLIVINNWGAPGKGDLDRDGAADIDDLLAVSNDWGAAAPRGRLNYFDNFGTDNILGANGTMYNQELSGTPGGGGVNGGAAGGGGGTYGGRGGGNFDSTTGRSSSRAGNPRGAVAMAAGLNGMMGDMGLGSMGISPGTGMCPKSEDSENSPIGDGGVGGEGGGGFGGGYGPGGGLVSGIGTPGGGSGRPPGWAWGAHDNDPETGKLIAPMEPMPTVREMGSWYDRIFRSPYGRGDHLGDFQAERLAAFRWGGRTAQGVIDFEKAALLEAALWVLPGGKIIEATGKVVKVSRAGKVYEYIFKARRAPGADGGESVVIVERLGGETVSVIHQVLKDGKVIHQHQEHLGKYGTRRVFPDEWIEYPTINQ